MEKYVQTLVNSMDKEIGDLEMENHGVVKSSKKAFKICETHKEKLRLHVLTYEFENDDAEIYFFKKLKHQIASKSIFFSAIYRIESACKNNSDEEKLSFYKSEMNTIKGFFKKNRKYYDYDKTDNQLLDQYYFLRKSSDINLIHKFENIDHNFSTGYDIYFIKIIALESVYAYLEEKLLADYESKRTPINLNFPHINWTAHKIDLIELMYALHSVRAFNHGVIDISVLATFFEQVFNFKLGNYYRTYIDMKIRNDRTRFLDKSTAALLDRLEKDL